MVGRYALGRPQMMLAAVLLIVQLAVADSVLAVLGDVADGNETEVIGCLTVRRDTVVAVRFPPLAWSQTNAAGLAEPCDLKYEAGFWHNHPPGQRIPPGPERASLCYLSDLDLKMADGFRYGVVHVDAETWCWWIFWQMRGALPLMHLQRVPGQFAAAPPGRPSDHKVTAPRP